MVEGVFGDLLDALPVQMVGKAVNVRIEELLSLDLERSST